MALSKVPLNGTKTHPLSVAALDSLRDIERKPVPPQEVNPGVVNRLSREDLVELVPLPSPYAKHKGANIPHLRITDAGRAALAAS